MIHEENWRYIPGTLDFEASDHGRIRRVSTGRIMQIGTHRGRARVKLYIRTQPYYFYVHRLVAKCFLEGYRDDSGVIHLDGDYKNNHVENLLLQGRVRSLLPKNLGVEVIETGEKYPSVAATARAIGGQTTNVSKTLNGFLNHHKGFTFRYVRI